MTKREVAVGFEAFLAGLRQLDVPPGAPVIVHTSLSAFGCIQGGAQAVVTALRQVFASLVMPSFTYQAMLIPEVGPADNAVVYGSQAGQNLLAQFYRAALPVHRLMGRTAECLRLQPDAQRSRHPLLSFVGVNAQPYLEAQNLAHPLAPIGELHRAGGWVLLLGVDHTVNTSIHYAEHLIGRKTFIRWALTPHGVVECPGFPGCSDGFEALADDIHTITRLAVVGSARMRALPLDGLLEAACTRLSRDPLALLCDHSYCERCRCLEEWERR